jgi:hypothetical protein
MTTGGDVFRDPEEGLCIPEGYCVRCAERPAAGKLEIAIERPGDPRRVVAVLPMCQHCRDDIRLYAMLEQCGTA